MEIDLKEFCSPTNQISPGLDTKLRTLTGFQKIERQFTFENCIQNDDLKSFNSFGKGYSPLSQAFAPSPFPLPNNVEAFVPIAESPHISPNKPPEFKLIKSEPLRRKNSNYFIPVISFLNTYFSQKPCVIDDSFDTSQMQIILAILKRKCGARESGVSVKKEEILEELRSYTSIYRVASSKRTEENNKFVFKHAIKLLKKQMARAASAGLSATAVDDRFFEKYFGDAPNSESSQTFKKVKTYSSLSLSTLRTIFKNEQLTRDFTALITEPSVDNSPLIADYTATLPKKVMKIFRRWNKKIITVANEGQVTRDLIGYFETNNQCKLPWTVKEIITAIQCFCDSILFYDTK